MADILDLIKSRRNIEEFVPKPVSWDKISKIIDAGRHASSSGNLQNWKFIVVMDADKKQSLAEISYGQYSIANAFALIIVCADPKKAERYYGLRGIKLYSIQNCAAAIQNMLLEAHSLGLGTRWIGAFDETKINSEFGIPDEIRPQAIIAVGHPKRIPEKPPKYPLETVVYFNGWRGKIKDIDAYFNNYSVSLVKNVNSAIKNTKKATKSTSNLLVKQIEDARPKLKSLAFKLKEKLPNPFVRNKHSEEKD